MNKDYSAIFKAYDIRSLYNDPMDTRFSYSLGVTLGKYFIEKFGEEETFLITSDGRTGNVELVSAFLAGFEDGGGQNRTVCNTMTESLGEQEHPFGVSSTAFFYWCMYNKFPLGTIFTASHNPPGRVGMKTVDSNAALLSSDFLQSIVEQYIPCPYDENHPRIHSIIEQVDQLLEQPDERVMTKRVEYCEIVADIFPDKLYTIVVDYSGGGATGYEYAYFQMLEEEGYTIIHLNQKTDSEFSAHLSDTNQPVNYEQLSQAVKKHHADFGIMFDGDGDRLGMVDEKGLFVSGDILLPLISKAVLDQQPGSHIIYDITCSNNVPEGIERFGGTSSPSKVGYKNVKAAMIENKAAFGGELSGHLLFPVCGYAESPIIALGYIMQTLSEYGSFSVMVDDFTHWIKHPVTNYHVEQKEQLLELIKEEYKGFPQHYLDGVRVDGDDWWFLVRASNTEPKVRVYVEAKDQKTISSLFVQLEQMIGSAPIG